AGLPLGPTHGLCDARMVNLMGDDVEHSLALLQADPSAKLHLYGKSEARSGRKMGHINYLYANENG
ncbi:MAG: 5-(carboxyamino)imidazole ribonucleotide synthase, partial [Rickettsiales bacterium]|nr:5-(carboxyamino)imidazole ribonucleotide synthase [Rickettsiales bacterium]